VRRTRPLRIPGEDRRTAAGAGSSARHEGDRTGSAHGTAAASIARRAADGEDRTRRHRARPQALMFTPSRDEARRFIGDAWNKYRDGQPLSALEQTVVGIVALHPEYHDLVENAQRHLEREWSPESGTMNPFLHLSLHLAIAEQLAIDQPAGIRAQFERLRAARGDEHEALHAVLDCLGETLWEAQRLGQPPDGDAYLACLKRR
jgi:hypothetical protein